MRLKAPLSTLPGGTVFHRVPGVTAFDRAG